MGKGNAAVRQWMGNPERFADLFNGMDLTESRISFWKIRMENYRKYTGTGIL